MCGFSRIFKVDAICQWTHVLLTAARRACCCCVVRDVKNFRRSMAILLVKSLNLENLAKIRKKYSCIDYHISGKVFSLSLLRYAFDVQPINIAVATLAWKRQGVDKITRKSMMKNRRGRRAYEVRRHELPCPFFREASEITRRFPTRCFACMYWYWISKKSVE